MGDLFWLGFCGHRMARETLWLQQLFRRWQDCVATLYGAGRKPGIQAGTGAGLRFTCLGASLRLSRLLLDKWISHPEGSTVVQNTCWGRDALAPIHDEQQDTPCAAGQLASVQASICNQEILSVGQH